MTTAQAIARLRNRTEYLQKKIVEGIADGRNVFWYEQDVLVNDLAISALEFLHATQEYEASQKQL